LDFIISLRFDQRYYLKSDYKKSKIQGFEIETSAKIRSSTQTLTKNQYLVEQAPSPAKYSRGRLFYMIFDAPRGSMNRAATKRKVSLEGCFQKGSRRRQQAVRPPEPTGSQKRKPKFLPPRQKPQKDIDR
jgi:hypothetical protein